METHPYFLFLLLLSIFSLLSSTRSRSGTSGLLDNDTAEEIAFSGGFNFIGVRLRNYVVVTVDVGSWVSIEVFRVTTCSVAGLSSSGVLTDEVFLIFLVQSLTYGVACWSGC